MFGLFAGPTVPRPEGIAGRPFPRYHVEVTRDSDGPVEFCCPSWSPRWARSPPGTRTWRRCANRATDPERSLPYRPWHPHDHAEPLTPGEIVPLDIEIWPTSVVVPAGYRLALTVTGRDFEFPGDGPWPETYGIPMKGTGMFVHTDPVDRPADVFGGVTTIVSGPGQPSALLLPVVPRDGRLTTVRRGPAQIRSHGTAS